MYIYMESLQRWLGSFRRKKPGKRAGARPLEAPERMPQPVGD